MRNDPRKGISTSSSEKVSLRLQVLAERRARLRAARERLAARASRSERKRDTRRKIVIGATVLVAFEHDGVPALRTREDLLRWLDGRLKRPQDRQALDLTPRALF